jgi:hypothetical protein
MQRVSRQLPLKPTLVSLTDLTRRLKQMQDGQDKDLDSILSSSPDGKQVADKLRGRPEYTERPEAILTSFVSGEGISAEKVGVDQRYRYFKFVVDLYVAALLHQRFQ